MNGSMRWMHENLGMREMVIDGADDVWNMDCGCEVCVFGWCAVERGTKGGEVTRHEPQDLSVTV